MATVEGLLGHYRVLTQVQHVFLCVLGLDLADCLRAGTVCSTVVVFKSFTIGHYKVFWVQFIVFLELDVLTGSCRETLLSVNLLLCVEFCLQLRPWSI